MPCKNLASNNTLHLKLIAVIPCIETKIVFELTVYTYDIYYIEVLTKILAWL